MKRLLTLILTLCLIFTLVACGNKKANNDNNTHSFPSAETTSSLDGQKDDAVSAETNNENKDESVEKDLMPKYKMAKIGSDSAVSTSKYGFEKTGLNSDEQDFTNKKFYALSWVLEEADWTERNYMYYTFKIKDVKTGKFLDSMSGEHYSIKYYSSTVYNTEDFEGNTGLRYHGYPSKQITVGILYTDYEIKFKDIEIWTEIDGINNKLKFNADLSEINAAPARSTGYSFIKFKNDYYVSDASSSGGGSGGGSHWNIYDFISVSNPLSSLNKTDAILDSSKITFYDTETKQHLKAIPGTELYYEEERKSDSIDVNIGIKVKNSNLGDDWTERYKVFYNKTVLLTER